MSAAEVMADLRARGIEPVACGGKLVLDGPEEAITAESVSLARALKAEILALLAVESGAAFVRRWVDHSVNTPAGRGTLVAVEGGTAEVFHNPGDGANQSEWRSWFRRWPVAQVTPAEGGNQT